MATNAEAYEVSTYETDGPSFHFVEPISPVDPFDIAPRTRPTTPTRQTQGTDFFEAVYLDSPFGANGTTRPLRVRKKSAANARIAGIGPSSPRRRSIVSMPHSPRSPSTPTSPRPRPSRTNTAMSTTSSVHPHHHISRIFLSLPVDVASLPPLPASQRRYRAPTNQSELHLGLGRFTAYDGSAQPGPSPPTSPAPSPTKRNFTHDSENRNVRPKYPASPLTPSRASRKAAELLGVNANTAVPRPTKKKEHFRPLPHQKLIEIDRFFGNVKPKPSKKHPGLKSNPRQATSQAKDGRVGEGETVPHKGDDGSMWLDVEEEQEFAWLMSEIFAAVPPPLPPLADGGELLWEERSDDEDQWGMEAFTSVLSLPKPKSDMNRRKGESFIELGTPAPRRVPRPEMASHPRSNPIPSTSRVTTPPSMSAPLLIPPPRTSSRDPSPSDSDSTSSSRQPKHRPPPLALPTSPPKSKRLPQLTATTPDRPKTKRATTEQPTTPFVKPRTAPRPAPSSEPIPAVPKLLPPLAITSMPEPRQEMSFFDPVTPIAQESRGRLGDWFSKVVNGVRF